MLVNLPDFADRVAHQIRVLHVVDRIPTVFFLVGQRAFYHRIEGFEQGRTDGQIAFVTGAGQGAGRVIAITLAKHNAGGVAVNDFVAKRAQAVADEIIAMSIPACAVPADVSDIESVAAAMISAGPYNAVSQ